MGEQEWRNFPIPSDPEKRLEAAQKQKDEGNDKFKQQEFAKARACYERAVRLTETPRAADGAVEEQIKAIRLPVLCNLALCCLRVEPEEAFRALEACEEVLSVEPDHAKATYRKGKALVELNELREAEYELTRACKLSPKDATVRKDLEQLRQRLKDIKAKEKATYDGLFNRSPGFASDARQAKAADVKQTDDDLHDICFHKGHDNPFESVDRPQEQARACQASGNLEDAVMAWEAAVVRAESAGEWANHSAYCLEFGVLLMDLNNDRLALRCFNVILEEGSSRPPSPPNVRRHALLLKAICSLNESTGDPLAEVSSILEQWWLEVSPATPGVEQPSIDTRLELCLGESNTSADFAVALGVIRVLQGHNSAPNYFVSALTAPEDDGSFFGDVCRRATKWNMLGAVLANRGKPDSAIVAYQQALCLQPHYPRALVNEGISHAARKSLSQAAASFVAALAVSTPWSAQPIWPLLEDVAKDVDGELEPLTKEKNISRLQELVGPIARGSPSPICEVLAEMGFA